MSGSITRTKKRKASFKEDQEEDFITPPTRRQRRTVVDDGIASVSRPRRTGSKKPLCTIYGKNRRQLYPDHFFCSECDLYEAESPFNKRINRFSVKYGCKADHKCWLFPTDVCETVRYQGKAVAKVFATPQAPEKRPAPEDVASPIEKAIENENCKELESLKKAFLNANQRINVQSRLIYKLRKEKTRSKKRVPIVLEEDEEPVLLTQKEKIISFLDSFFEQAKQDKFISGHKKLTKIFALELAKRILDMNLLNGTVMEVMVAQVKLHLRRTVFSPWKILRAMDLRGGTLGLEGYEILRELETNGDKWVRGTLLPCSADIKRAQEIVERFGDIVVPWSFLDTTEKLGGAEAIAFDPGPMLAMTIKAFGLTEEAKERPIGVAQSIDGAQLTKNTTHVSYGYKINDKAAKCPVTGRPLFASRDSTLIQSRNNCFPTCIALAKETKATYEFFAKPFADLEKAASVSVPEKYGFQPITLKMNCDMSAHWKALGKGGAAKIHNHPCHCCNIHSDHLAVPSNLVDCKFCLQYGDDIPDGHECFHREFLTEDKIESMKVELDEVRLQLQEQFADVNEVQLQSLIRTNEDPRTQSATALTSSDDLFSIHFAHHNADPDEKRSFANKVAHDLTVRNVEIINNDLEEWVSKLRDSLEKEFILKRLEDGLALADKGSDKALYTLINALPCILHMENRVGLKVLSRLLTIGISNAIKGVILSDVGKTEKSRFEALMSNVCHIVNYDILGEPDNPSQWDCPRDDKKRILTPITLDNVRTRKIINNIGLIIDLCIPEEVDRRKWKKSVGHYRNSMEIIRCKDDLTDDQIIEYQKSADAFFCSWLDINGQEGVTNYIHMIGAGHMTEYLFHWRNLYVHSQQGWEAYNSLLKTFFFRRTARGGAGNKGKGKKSKLKAIARWLQRRVIWICGIDYDTMLETLRED